MSSMKPLCIFYTAVFCFFFTFWNKTPCFCGVRNCTLHWLWVDWTKTMFSFLGYPLNCMFLASVPGVWQPSDRPLIRADMSFYTHPRAYNCIIHQNTKILQLQDDGPESSAEHRPVGESCCMHPRLPPSNEMPTKPGNSNLTIKSED